MMAPASSTTGAGKPPNSRWSALEVFGVSVQTPRTHSEMAGLLPFIAGGTVVAISASSATIRSASGDEVVWLRRSRSGAVAVWELAPPDA
jgi:hypothetical protein